MKKIYTTIVATLLCGLMSCCSAVRTASLGAGAHAGKDYVTGLRPSADARRHFTSRDPNAPVETVSRGSTGSRSGVRYVANDGILIPPGVTISFSNKGYCMDPHLPAPKAGDEYQLIPVSAMIPSSLQYTYQNLVKKAAAGDANVRGNMQGLVWALRTAGTPNSHAARLTASQKRILDSCSARPGDFERIHQNGMLTQRLIGEAWKLADSALHVKVGNHTWKASDFSSPAAFNSAVDSQLNSLIALGNNLPVQHTGFNYGELEPGIYTDIRGNGTLSFTAKIANNSGKDFIFYPCNYVGQVGNGSALSAVAFGAAASGGKKQHVSMGPVTAVNAVNQQGPTKKTKEVDILNNRLAEKFLGITLYNYRLKLDENQKAIIPKLDIVVIRNSGTCQGKAIEVNLNEKEIKNRYKELQQNYPQIMQKVTEDDFTQSVIDHEYDHAKATQQWPYIQYLKNKDNKNGQDLTDSKLLEARAMASATLGLMKSCDNLTLEEATKLTVTPHKIRQNVSKSPTYQEVFNEFYDNTKSGQSEPARLREMIETLNIELKALHEKKVKWFEEI